MDHNAQLPKQLALHNAPLQLQVLPCELLVMVVENLAPCDLERYPESKGRLEQRKGSRDLGNMCLVSKKLRAITRPVLFKTIVIFRPTSLVKLYRTLLENQHVGDYIRHMVLDTTFDRKEVDYELLDIRPLSGLDPDFDYWLRAWPGLPHDKERDLIFSLYLKVLNRALGIETLAINAPATMRRYYEDTELSDSQMGVSDQLCSHLDFESYVRQPMLTTLPKLNTVRLLGCPDRMIDHISGQIGSLTHDGETKQPSLERLIWIKDAAHWFNTLPFQQHRMFGSKQKCDIPKVLELHGSSCWPEDITTICDSFPSLQVLSVVSSRGRTLSRGYYGGGPPTSGLGVNFLTSDLEKLQHLEVLRLDWNCHGDIRPILGPGNTLNLTGLPKLQSLTVPIQYFMLGHQDNQGPAMKDPGTSLPQSLCSLTLLAEVECLWDALKTRRSRALKPLQETFFEFLDALHALRTEQFSSMTSITYLYGDLVEKIEDGNPCGCNGPRVRCRYHDSKRILSLASPVRHSPKQPERFGALVEEFSALNVQLKEDYMMIHH